MMDIYWLEAWHVPARQMECGLEMNLSVVRLLDIPNLYASMAVVIYNTTS